MNHTIPLPQYYPGNFFEKNFVYAAGMSLAWNELKTKIFHDDVKISDSETDKKADKAHETNRAALSLVQFFNNTAATTEDIDPLNYYAKAGFGQTTVDTVKRELQHRFPGKSFDELEISIFPRDLIVYAMLLVKVQYHVPFTTTDIFFDGVDTVPGKLSPQVRAFKAETMKQKSNIDILSYMNVDTFIIRIKLKQQEEEIIMAKGLPMEDASKMVTMLQPYFEKQGEPLCEQDSFSMPVLHLDYGHRYDSLIGRQFANPGFQDYAIAAMSEHIFFDMDKTGARIENRALMVAPRAAEPEGPAPKYLYLNRPFWLLMKKKTSSRPYFILGVNTTDVMEKVRD